MPTEDFSGKCNESGEVGTEGASVVVDGGVGRGKW